MMLEAEADFSVVGEASDLDETQALLLDLAPSVLVLDLHMGRELSSGHAVHAARRVDPQPRS